ncbi:MAG: chemotaxis protein CheW [candidate division KSB1 bacterium]|nr:chemotaxis protein CheW [candidate division KSB1 bacterium]
MDFAAEFIQSFLEEAQESIELLDRELVHLEETPDDKTILDEIFRVFHTLKGNAGMLGFQRLEKVAHVTEEVLTEIRNGKRHIDEDLITFLLEATDLLKEFLIIIEADGSDAEGPTKLPSPLASIASEAAPSESQQPKKQAVARAETRSNAQVDQSQDEGESGKDSQHNEHTIPAKQPENISAPADKGSISGEESPALDAKRPHGEHEPVDRNAHRLKADSAIRVDVTLLDNLMNMVGELVLARNQIIQFASKEENPAYLTAAQRLNVVTSELQEGIMKTRMQPIGNVFNRFPRVVRDIAKSLNKKVTLKLDGEETELDKTIIEAIRDPLVHLIRNSIDHGIEPPDQRKALGKDPRGQVLLRAYHEGGQVIIEIIDDGAGINSEHIRQKALEKGLITQQQAQSMNDRDALQLIFQPGFSTKEQVTAISGRGVGMDVVKTDIEKIGGTVEIHSEVSHGTTITIKIPLTLAIIPALIVTSGQQRFAIPQVNLIELVCLDSEDNPGIEKLGDAEIYRLRGHLLPLIRLSKVLQLSGRQLEKAASTNIVVLSTGGWQFGLIVDQIHDTEEIVVKPLGKHLKNIDCFAGASVMGDGKVALILDVVGLSKIAKLVLDDVAEHSETEQVALTFDDNVHSLLLFRIHPDSQFAIPSSLVSRLETCSANHVQHTGKHEVIQYRDRILPLIRLETILPIESPLTLEVFSVVVFQIEDHIVGFVVAEILDIFTTDQKIDASGIEYDGVLGTCIIHGKVTQVIDVYKIISNQFPEWFIKKEVLYGLTEPEEKRILLVDDSPFIRSIERSYLESEGYSVIEAQDGQEALDLLNTHPFDIIVTDIDMPRMNGLELVRAIRNSDRYSNIPVVAVSSLAEPENIAEGKKAGMDAYLQKLSRDELIMTLKNFGQQLS